MSEELTKGDDGEVSDEEAVVNEADLQGFLLKIAVGGIRSRAPLATQAQMRQNLF